MSSILKALKKVEEQKGTQKRNLARLESQLLSGPEEKSRRKRGRKTGTLVLGLALLGLGAGVWYFTGASSDAPIASPGVVLETTPSVVPDSPPLVENPEIQADVQAMPKVAEPAKETSAITTSPQVIDAPSVELAGEDGPAVSLAGPAPASDLDGASPAPLVMAPQTNISASPADSTVQPKPSQPVAKKHTLVRSVQPQRQKIPQPVASPAKPVAPAIPIQTVPVPQIQETAATAAPEIRQVNPPPLMVSGIVFQDDPTRRFALVNDRMVREGETVSGAILETIEKDRLKFKYQGQPVEIFMGHSSPLN